MPRPPIVKDSYQWIWKLSPGHHCSMGLSDNMLVAADGTPSPGGRANEDKFFTCSSHSDKVQVYMVLDGHDGIRACEFAQKHLPSVLLQSDIRDEHSLLTALKRAFYLTEREFFMGIDPYITRRMTLQLEIDQKARNSAEAQRLYPGQVQEMQSLDEYIRGGTTVVISVVYNNKLYVANCGDSRALLCAEDLNGKVVPHQMSTDHNTNNEDELTRLAELGLDPHILRRHKRLGTQQNTRSIGDYSIKGGYKDIDTISHAKQEPGIADPFIAHPFDLTSFRGFLLLMSDGLYDAYESWSDRPATVNEDIAQLVAKEIRSSTEFHFVAQKVVENVKSKFQESCKKEKHTGRMDDITLIVRNFGYPNLPHSTSFSGIPSTAPVVTGQQSVFFPTQRPDVSYYPQSVSPPPNQTYHDYTTSLPPGYDNRQQPPYPTSPIHYPGDASVGRGVFVPEPANIPDYHRQMGQQNSVSPAGYGQQTNDWPGYYSQGPPNDQPEHPRLTSVASFPNVSQPLQKSRHQSVPSMNNPQQWGTGQTLPSNPEFIRSRDYMNVTMNPLGTDQTQSELSTSRSSLYENVTLRTQEVPSTDLKRYSDSNLEQQTKAMFIQDSAPPKRTVPVDIPPQNLSVISQTKTPSPSKPPSSAAATVASTSTPPALEVHNSPNLKRNDSDFELYGWRMEDPAPSSLATEGSTLPEEKSTQHDTLQEKPLFAEVVKTPKIAAPLESEVITSTPAIPQTRDTSLSSEAATEQVLVVEDLEEGQETLRVDMSEEMEEPRSENEGDDTDGQIRAFVKFPDTFPDIAWDEIKF